MGHANYANYVNNGWRGVNDSEKKYPIVLPWNTTFFNTNGTLKAPIKLSGNVLKQLRQHIKAIDANFVFPGTANFLQLGDDKLAPGVTKKKDHFHQGASPLGTNEALLDEMAEIGILGSVTGVSTGARIDKAKIDEIAARLTTAASYSNYSNHFNTASYTGGLGYANLSGGHSNTATGRGWMCHRHSHTNHSNTSGNNHRNTTVEYANTSHANTFQNPATYQDNL